MAELLSLYPLSSPKGEAIPYDIIRSRGLIRQDFTDAASPSVSIPANTDILSCWATNDCIIRFGSAAVVPSNGTIVADEMIIPAHTFMNIDHNGAANFSVIGITSPGGILFVASVDKWKEIRKSKQFTNI